MDTGEPNGTSYCANPTADYSTMSIGHSTVRFVISRSPVRSRRVAPCFQHLILICCLISFNLSAFFLAKPALAATLENQRVASERGYRRKGKRSLIRFKRRIAFINEC
jgi:hypothetical protein